MASHSSTTVREERGARSNVFAKPDESSVELGDAETQALLLEAEERIAPAAPAN